MFNLNPNVLVACIVGIIIVIAGGVLLFRYSKRETTSTYDHVMSAILTGLAIQFVCMPPRGYGGMEVSSAVGFALYLVATNFFLKKQAGVFKTYVTVALVLAGASIIQLPLHVVYFTDTLISFPDMLLEMLGIVAGYFFYCRKRFIYKINFSVCVLVLLFTCGYGYKLWLHYLSYGNFTGSVIARGPSSVNLVSSKAEPFEIKKGKITVMDFWFIGCKPCMDGFPAFQKTYNEYKSNPKVQFYSVNSRTPWDEGANCFNLLTDLGYSFPMAVTPDNKLIKALNVTSFPTTIILDENGNVVYKGENADIAEKLKSLL